MQYDMWCMKLTYKYKLTYPKLLQIQIIQSEKDI